MLMRNMLLIGFIATALAVFLSLLLIRSDASPAAVLMLALPLPVPEIDEHFPAKIRYYDAKEATPSSGNVGKKKLVLDWTGFWPASNTPTFALVWKMCQQDCPYTCEFTTDRHRFAEADALLFFPVPGRLKRLPPTRTTEQAYVFNSMEAPPSGAISGNTLGTLPANFFNWTMTYRRDSDIFQPYFRVHKRPEPMQDMEFEAIRRVALGKTLMVAWFVSHCHTHSARELYADALSRVVPVDIFGSCGNRSCPRKRPEVCTEMLRKDYRFYLAFENAVCQDYVTEKLSKASMNLAVPIVLRAADYEDILPPKSYIAADQFASEEQLGAYLRRLSENASEYLEYFEWRKWYEFKSLELYGGAEANPAQRSCDGLCTMCAWLNGSPKPSQSWTNVHAWITKPACEQGFAKRLVSPEFLRDYELRRQAKRKVSQMVVDRIR